MARRTDDREFMLRVREAAVALVREDFVDLPNRAETFFVQYLRREGANNYNGRRPTQPFDYFKEYVFAVLEQLDCVEECINKYDGVDDVK